MIKVFSNGFTHWFQQRISAISLLLLLLVLFVYKNIVISTGVLILLLFHFKTGFETLMEDYIHDVYLKNFGNVVSRLMIIYLIKFIFLLSIL